MNCDQVSSVLEFQLYFCYNTLVNTKEVLDEKAFLNCFLGDDANDSDFGLHLLLGCGLPQHSA